MSLKTNPKRAQNMFISVHGEPPNKADQLSTKTLEWHNVDMNLLLPSPELEGAAVSGIDNGGLIVLETVLVQRLLQLRKLGFVVLVCGESSEGTNDGLQGPSGLVEMHIGVGWSGQVVHCLEPAKHKECNFVAFGIRGRGDVHWTSHLDLHVLGVLARNEVEAAVKPCESCPFVGGIRNQCLRPYLSVHVLAKLILPPRLHNLTRRRLNVHLRPTSLPSHIPSNPKQPKHGLRHRRTLHQRQGHTRKHHHQHHLPRPHLPDLLTLSPKSITSFDQNCNTSEQQSEDFSCGAWLLNIHKSYGNMKVQAQAYK
ncbi:hypothetical protein M758_6G199600 [Ceratodon purpureus]|nr:hypothetical protein M758_6G199600 [Ceratodon purpureus]